MDQLNVLQSAKYQLIVLGKKRIPLSQWSSNTAIKQSWQVPGLSCPLQKVQKL